MYRSSRYISFILFFVYVFLPAFVFADGNTVRLTSYYPIPTGIYQTIRLVPTASKPLPCLLGTLYTDEAHPGFLEYCRTDIARGVVWSPLFGVWKQVGNNVYPTDTTSNPNIHIGIGTDSPEFKLTLDQDGGIFTTGNIKDDGSINTATSKNITTSGPGTRLFWYPKQAVFRAGNVTADQWDDANLGTYSVVSGGQDNKATGTASVASFGYNNQALASYSTIIGGKNNTVINDLYGSIGGGLGNRVSRQGGVIGGGENNQAGHPTLAQGQYSTICGGNTNAATGDFSTICGGHNNHATGNSTAICGGENNIASGAYSGVSGGLQNTASGNYSYIGGGNQNSALGAYTVILGGKLNSCDGTHSTIGGGDNNQTTGSHATVWGGSHNTARGNYSVIAGGSYNVTLGAYSFAAGKNMNVTGDHTFAWGYSDIPVDIPSTDSFIIYDAKVGIGGIVDPQEQLHVNGDMKVNGKVYIADLKNNGNSSNLKISDSAPHAIGLDIAERFETSQDVQAGDLLVGDDTKTHQLKKSSLPYDSRFIGIVSSSPALIFKGNQVIISASAKAFTQGREVPVALAGRVLCKVSDEGGPISAGDLLTTSSLPGHAMKASDPQKSRGAIIGKALEPFNFESKKSKTGKVIVLVGH